MTNQLILEKAIQKAIDGGLKVEWIAKDAFRVWSIDIQPLGDGTNSLETPCVEHDLSKPHQFILNHQFAKALWGDDTDTDEYSDNYYLGGAHGSVPQDVIPAWQYHLQQMVIAEDPIKYLAEHLEG